MSNVNNPMYAQVDQSPKKSNKGLLFGVLGCGGLLMLICCGGLAYFAYFSYNIGLNNEGVKEAKELASNSAEVRQALGDNITFQMPTDVNNSTPESIKYRIPMNGDKGSGTLVLTSRLKTGTFNFELESASVEISGGDSITLK